MQFIGALGSIIEFILFCFFIYFIFHIPVLAFTFLIMLAIVLCFEYVNYKDKKRLYAHNLLADIALEKQQQEKLNAKIKRLEYKIQQKQVNIKDKQLKMAKYQKKNGTV